MIEINLLALKVNVRTGRQGINEHERDFDHNRCAYR